MAPLRAFRLPTRVLLEPGSFQRLASAVASCAPRAQRVLLVTDAGLKATSWPRKAKEQLEKAALSLVEFAEVEANPRASTVERLAAVARSETVGCVIALGGGSVLDAAKAAAMLATNGGRCEDFEGARSFVEKPLPFIAVPTTCGTGSEVTWVSVISVEERKSKISIKGDGMFPDVALVDPDLLISLPRDLVVWTGLDAMTHALEALTGTARNPASDALATQAVRSLFDALPRAAADISGDGEARSAMAQGSTLAGMAFGNADVAAVHCLSETLGGLFDVPHGLANAILLVPVLRSHGSSVSGPLGELARNLGWADAGSSDGEASQEALERIEGLVDSLGLPTFASLEVPTAEFSQIALRSTQNGSNASNPRPMGPEEYLQILENLLGPCPRSCP